MANKWLKNGLNKMAVFSKHGSDEGLEFSPIEFRAVCNHLELSRDGISGASEYTGLSKVATTTILTEKLSLDPATALLVGGSGIGVSKLWPKIQPYGRALAQKILPRHAKTDIAVENITKALRGMPKGDQGRVIKEVMDTAKAGPMLGRSPITWSPKEVMKALGMGAGLGAGGYIAGKKLENRSAKGGKKMVLVT